MAAGTPEGQLPRYLQSRVAEALRNFTDDADGDDRNTSQGLHDVLERAHGLNSVESRDQLTRVLQRKEQTTTEMDEQIRTTKSLSESAQQLIGECTEAREKIMADHKALGKWKHTKPAELVQKGLSTISEFVTSNPAIVPDLLDILKVPGDHCRSDISSATKNASDALSQLADMQRRCDQILEDGEIETQEEPNPLVREIESQLTLARQRLDEKSLDFENMRERFDQATETARAAEEELKALRSCSEIQTNKLQESDRKGQDLQVKVTEHTEKTRQAVRDCKLAKNTLAQELDRFTAELSTKEHQLQKICGERDRLVKSVRSICETILGNQSTVDEGLSLTQLIGQAVSGVAAEKDKCVSLEQQLTAAKAELQRRETLLENLTRAAAENGDRHKKALEQQETIANQRELLAKLPSLEEYNLIREKLEKAENEAGDASNTDGTLRFCSSVLASISACENDLHTRKVDIQTLRVDWDIAVDWSERTRSSSTHRKLLPVVDGLVKPIVTSHDALTLARLLLVRAHTSPSLLSVALVEQLATALSTAGEMVVTRAIGFLYALLQQKSRNTRDQDLWPIPTALLVVRCLSILAAYVCGVEVCSELVTSARSIRDKIPPSSILIRVMLEHAINLLTNSPQSLVKTMEQSTFARRVKAASYTLYPDGQNLMIVSADGHVGYVRPNQFDWHNEENEFQPYMTFVEAPLMGTCRIMLPSFVEEQFLFDILHDAMNRAENPQTNFGYQPDYTFTV